MYLLVAPAIAETEIGTTTTWESARTEINTNRQLKQTAPLDLRIVLPPEVMGNLYYTCKPCQCDSSPCYNEVR